MRRLFVLIALLFVVPAHAVTIDWVTVGDPGNNLDHTGYGSVSYTYLISKYEVTNAQYAEFLNAVDPTGADALGLYNTAMGSGYGGITTVGCPGSNPYCAIANREDMPVNYVSFYDALRFANWLNNGQGNATTETGAYTLLGRTPIPNNGLTVTRNAGATIFLTSEDEWYKAAYYDAVSTSYLEYPAGTDVQTVCALPGTTANTANCFFVLDDFTDVGSYTSSPSPEGTFDQGGNAWEWHEAIVSVSSRGCRGGSFEGSAPGSLAASYRCAAYPVDEFSDFGFRVAMIPEPSTALLLACGLAGLAAAGRRRLLH